MRDPGKLALLLVGVGLAGAALASCMLDLTGLPGISPTTTTTGTGGGGGVTTTSTTTGAGGATTTTSTATGAGGSGGSGGAAPVCGDHTQAASEECDDGNLVALDGCSPTCTIEPLDSCPGLPIALAPPGLTIKGTLVGAHDDVAPSCGTNLRDVIYEVTPTVSGTLVATLAGPFDKSLSVRSSCLDSKNGELDCGAGVGDLTLRRWVYAGVKYDVLVDAGEQPFSLRLDLFACGDGIKEELEDCDNAMDPTCLGCFKCAGPGEFLDPVSRHCYRRLGNQAKDWKSARKDCLAWGGDLAALSSVAEVDYLKTQQSNDAWTGATDTVEECHFAWVNGEPWQPHWGNGEPNNSGNNEDCGVFFSSGNMDDRSCDEHHDALCERAPSGSCGDMIVQPGEECDDAITYVGVSCAGCVITCLPGQIEDPATRHCYEIVPGPADWNGAKTDCFNKGAYLAAITTPAENALLQVALPGPMWIGASRGGAFSWVNTDAFCFANWVPDPPAGGKNCGTVQMDGTWTTEDCAQKQGYVCERDN